jgi:hypothetical protein
MFPELSWRRDPFLSSQYTLPAGFLGKSALLTGEAVTIFEDIHALQLCRDSSEFRCKDAISILNIDNQQAWIESRIYSLRQTLSSSDYILDCCLIAAYLCTYAMFTDIWDSRLIPSHCSSQLLRKLQLSESSLEWIGHEDLLLWLLCMGGALVSPRVIATEYAVLLNGTFGVQLRPLIDSWSNLESCLRQFIWSERAFRDSCKAFWQNNCSF